MKNVIQNFLIYMSDNYECNFMFNDQFYVFVCLFCLVFFGGKGGFGFWLLRFLIVTLFLLLKLIFLSLWLFETAHATHIF